MLLGAFLNFPAGLFPKKFLSLRLISPHCKAAAWGEGFLPIIDYWDHHDDYLRKKEKHSHTNEHLPRRQISLMPLSRVLTRGASGI